MKYSVRQTRRNESIVERYVDKIIDIVDSNVNKLKTERRSTLRMKDSYQRYRINRNWMTVNLVITLHHLYSLSIHFLQSYKSLNLLLSYSLSLCLCNFFFSTSFYSLFPCFLPTFLPFFLRLIFSIFLLFLLKLFFGYQDRQGTQLFDIQYSILSMYVLLITINFKVYAKLLYHRFGL